MDISLYYEEKGSGFPLIMLHGNGEEHGYFEHQTYCFAENYRVIAIDTRGHGRSPRGEGEFSIKRFADDHTDITTAIPDIRPFDCLVDDLFDMPARSPAEGVLKLRTVKL